jgi:rod shape-determining protein MreC
VYDRKTVRRRRAVLGLLVACSLILVTVSFGDGLRSIERGALEVFGPVQEGTSRVLAPFRDAFGWVGDTIGAKGKLDKVEADRDALRRQVVEERDALQENARLRALLRMDKRLGIGAEGAVTARVFVRSPTIWYSTVTVNKGSSDGVREGQPVINGAGLVGVVRRVAGGRSQILLITDGEFGAQAKVNETDASGILETAVGDPNDLRLGYLGRHDDVQDDQTVVTSGSTSEKYPSLFPEGIPIGRVTSVDDDGTTAHVRPFADLRDLDYVQILTKSPAA